MSHDAREGELHAALQTWSLRHDRVRSLLLIEANKREAMEWDRDDAVNVIGFLLSRLDSLATPSPDPVLLGEVRQALETIRGVLPSGAGTGHRPASDVIPFYITLGELRTIRIALAKLPKLTGEEV